MKCNISLKKDISSIVVVDDNNKPLSMEMNRIFDDLSKVNYYAREYEEADDSVVVWLKDNSIHFYTGLINSIVGFLKNKNIEIEISNNDIKKHDKIDNYFKVNVSLRDYQREAVGSAIKDKRGIIKIGTGGGKTIISFAIMEAMRKKSLFITNQADMKNQVYQSLLENTSINKDNVLIYDNKNTNYKDKQVVIVTMSMIKNIVDKDFYDNFGLIVIDECHHAGANNWFSNINKFNCFSKIGLSATPGREDGYYNRVFSSIGKVIYKKSAKELQEQGYLLKLKSVFIEYNPERDFNKVSNKLHFINLEKSYIVNNKERNDFIISVIKELYQQDRTILVIVKTVNHGEILYNEIKFGKKILMMGSKNVKGDDGEIKRVSVNPAKRKPQIEKIKNGEYNIIIATKIFNEAMDISTLNACVNVSSGKSAIEIVQKIGRILRLQDEVNNAVYYDIFDLGNKDGNNYFSDNNPFYKQGIKRIKEIEGNGFDIEYKWDGKLHKHSSKGVFR